MEKQRHRFLTFTPLRQDGLLKAARGLTSLEEVYRVTGTDAEAA